MENNLMDLTSAAMEKIKQAGADEGQVFVTEGESRSWEIENGEFTLCKTKFYKDTNLIVYKDNKKGSYYTNKADLKSVEMSCDMAMQMLADAEPDEANGIAPKQREISAHKGAYEADMDLLFDRVMELKDEIEKNYPDIVIGSIGASHDKRHMCYRNTNETVCDEYIGSYNVSLSVNAKRGDETTSLAYEHVKLTDLKTPLIECGSMRLIVEQAVNMLGAKPLEERFTGTVLMTPNMLDTFMSYVRGLVDQGSIMEGASIWKDKLNQRVADERLTVYINPEDSSVAVGETLTFDGFASEPFYFIENGILRSFSLDYYGEKKTGFPRMKNGSGNAIISPGSTSLEDMIKHIENGILMADFSGGQPSVNGDFSGVAKNSMLIKNGRIAGPVTETMISGNLAEMVQNIREISCETIADGNGSRPYISVDGILISGKE